MPILADFSYSKYQDGILTISLVPPTNVTGWNIVYTQYKRFGSTSGIFTVSTSSGYNAVSGINVVNYSQGIFQVTLQSVYTSGLSYGNYAGMCERMDSGYRTVLSEGYLILTP